MSLLAGYSPLQRRVLDTLGLPLLELRTRAAAEAAAPERVAADVTVPRPGKTPAAEPLRGQPSAAVVAGVTKWQVSGAAPDSPLVQAILRACGGAAARGIGQPLQLAFGGSPAQGVVALPPIAELRSGAMAKRRAWRVLRSALRRDRSVP